jgi:hypothetical protein
MLAGKFVYSKILITRKQTLNPFFFLLLLLHHINWRADIIV